MKRLVVADASPLIGLAAAGAFDVLQRLFGTVTITRIVREELRAGGALPGAAELETALRDGWIRVAPAPMETWTFGALDAGEASTIALALEAGADGSSSALVLMDDELGREQAAAVGLEVISLAQLLLAAKRAQLVDRVQPLFARLARRGFTIPAASVHAVLAEADEVEPERRAAPQQE